jgi:ribosomal protein S17
MTTTALRNKLAKRIQREEDKTVLTTIEILLRDDTKEDALRRRMTEMAIRSEDAIKNGDVMSITEARKRSKDVLKDIAASRSKAKRA